MNNFKFVLLLAAMSLPPALALILNVETVRRSWNPVELDASTEDQLPCPPGVDCASSLSEVEGQRVAHFDLVGDPGANFRSLVDFLRLERGASVLRLEADRASFLFVAPYVKLSEQLDIALDVDAARIDVRAFSRLGSVPGRAEALIESIRGRWVGPQP